METVVHLAFHWVANGIYALTHVVGFIYRVPQHCVPVYDAFHHFLGYKCTL